VIQLATAAQDQTSQPCELVIDNRRIAYRFAANVPLECRYSDGSSAAGTSINLSRTGARVVLRGGVHDNLGQVTLKLGRELELKAHRVWQQDLAYGASRVVGLAFDTPTLEQQAKLNRFLSDQGRR
jgi:hypothetical protein